MTTSLHPITDAYKCSRMHPGQEAMVGRLMAALEARARPKPQEPAPTMPEAKRSMLETVAALVNASPGMTYAQLGVAAGTRSDLVKAHCFTLRHAGRVKTHFTHCGRSKTCRVYPVDYDVGSPQDIVVPPPMLEIVMAYIVANPGLPYAELATRMCLTSESVKYFCGYLREAGRIVTRMVPMIHDGRQSRLHGVMYATAAPAAPKAKGPDE